MSVFVEDYEEEEEPFWFEDPITNGPLQHQYVETPQYRGVAFFVDTDDGDGNVTAHMVGDDRPFYFDMHELTILDREAFCGQCGQIGCTHDGLDRS